MTFVPDDPYEIRDRGFIYQQLDCHNVALNDYQFLSTSALKTQQQSCSRLKSIS
ncbi:protein SirB1 [Vibrio astriarenae]|nr:protein SirB1 [Vibrio sp. C7]